MSHTDMVETDAGSSAALAVPKTTTALAALPRGPRLPGLVQLVLLFIRPTGFLTSCASRFGHTFTLRIPGVPPFVQTSEPAFIEAIFKGDPDIFLGGKANIGLKPVVGENSLLLLDGRRHRLERKLIMPKFLGERMHAYGSIISDIVKEAIDTWPIGKPFAVQDETQRIMLEVILRVIFGFDNPETIAEFRHHVHRVLKLALLLFPSADGTPVAEGFVRKLGRLVPALDVFASLKAIDDIIYREIDDRRRADISERQDVLSLMMQARYDDGALMSPRELRDELMTLLMAGHETSATIAAWCVYHVHQHPDTLRKLREEIAAHGNGEAVPLATINELKFLDAVVKETMRITPVFSLVARVLKEPRTFGNATYPANVILSPNIYGTHHRADLWGDPEVFRPERFLEDRASAFHYFPFGGGIRKCIGMSFAYYEMKIFLSEMVRRVQFRTTPGFRAKVVRRHNTLAPSKGVPIVVESRLPF
jgi:cytochrome P450